MSSLSVSNECDSRLLYATMHAMCALTPFGDGGNDGRDGTTTQRYAASEQPIEVGSSRSPL